MFEIKDNPILLYGKKRYMLDMKYVFEDMLCINSMYCDDEITFAEVLEVAKSSGEIVVVCQYDTLKISQNAMQIGAKKNVDYLYADSLFSMLDFPIEEISKTRDVYVWGLGAVGHSFCHEFIEKNPKVEISGFIDSSCEKQHKTWFRRMVYSPEEVLNTDCFIIIASDDYYDEIKGILESYGKKVEVDFIHKTAINCKASWMMRETIYDKPRLDYVCNKPFKDSVLGERGGLSVCAGIMNMPSWGVPCFFSRFSSVWRSNIMRVLRLSIINGTYSFCDKVKCNYLFECGTREIDLDELHYYTSYDKQSLEAIASKKEYPKDYIYNVDNYEIKENEYPEVVFMSFDSSCNLRCPSCRENIMVATDLVRKNLINFDNRMKEELYPFVKRIKCSGSGEVFASEVHQSTIYDEKIAHQVKSIGILSNGSLLDKSKFDKIYELYEEIAIFISMDGATKATAEKLRRGINFDRWKANMEYIGMMRHEGKIKQLSFNFVVQRDNYFEMVDFAKMCLAYSADAIKFSKVYKSRTISDTEFKKISMFDSTGKMLPELAEVVKDEIFKLPQIHLFTWLDW